MSLSAKFKKFSKPAVAEEEIVTTPAPTPKQALPKNEIIDEDDDFMEDGVGIVEDHGDEEEVVPMPPKKTSSKKVVVMKDDEDDEEVVVKPSKKQSKKVIIEEDDEDEVVAPPKKVASKKVAVMEDDEDEDEVVVKPSKKATPAPAKKTGGFGKKKEIESSSKELKPGDWMPYETFLQLFHEKLQEELGDGAPDTKATSSKVLKCVENLMFEVLKDYDLRWMGSKFARSNIAERVYPPHNGKLESVKSPYHTLVGEHERVTLSLAFNKVSAKGTMDKNNNFVEGKFTDDDKFVKGKWEGETFTPATAKKK